VDQVRAFIPPPADARLYRICNAPLMFQIFANMETVVLPMIAFT
jgi:hypothetical protein